MNIGMLTPSAATYSHGLTTTPSGALPLLSQSAVASASGIITPSAASMIARFAGRGRPTAQAISRSVAPPFRLFTIHPVEA